MGNSSNKYVNFETVQNALNDSTWIVINTMHESDQKCLIEGTINCSKESEIMNEYLETRNFKINIIIYGRNYHDNDTETKYNQLKKLGFENVFIYSGGLFEWMLLHEVYGSDNFKTTGDTDDLLAFRYY